MPNLDLVIESPVEPSFRVEQVRGLFDVPNRPTTSHRIRANLPLDEQPWKIGLIVGPSGSGKTTIGRSLSNDAYFHDGYAWPDTKAVVDGFPAHLEGRDITQALSAVGFSSPPHWLKRFGHLSNGQRFRCELARLLLEDAETIICDEFTSVIDRDAAKVSSAAVAKAIRSRGRPRLIALSCHYDVIDWLDPDWVFDTANATFAWRSLRGRPPIELRVHQATGEAWPLFREHHYLTGELHSAARCFVATWRDQPVSFTSYVHFPHPRVKQAKRGHRTVVLPDYQGVGIGVAINEWRAAWVKAQGCRFYFTTSHPALIRHCCRSPLWRKTSLGHQKAPGTSGTYYGKTSVTSSSASRITGSFEYVGPAWKDSQARAKEGIGEAL